MKIKQISCWKRFSVLFSVVAFISGCGAGFQAAGDVAQGRQALFTGDNASALAYFQNAAQVDPQYIYGTELRTGVWSYVGRAQYLNGQLGPARQTLEKARTQNRSDNLAVLYLGLTLARQDDRKNGLQQIETGMKGMSNFLNYITTTFAMEFGQFWDPNRDIRNAIDSDLAMVTRGNFDWAKLIADCERIGIKFEQEPDRALQEEEQQTGMGGRR